MDIGIITAIILAVGAVIAATSVLVSVIKGLRSEIHDLRREVKTEIAELRGALLAHISGHSHTPQTFPAAAEKTD